MIDNFGFSLKSSLRASLISSHLGSDFVTEGTSVILYGKTDQRNSHIAVAIAFRATQNGFEAVFTTAAQLIDSRCR